MSVFPTRMNTTTEEQPRSVHLTALRLLLLCLLAMALPLRAEVVTLQLKWTHAFQFAGYYAAKAKGYYRDAGLEVNILASRPGMDPLQPVLSGEAQYGVGTSSLLLARQAGRPVVVLAVIFQHSPLVLIARQTSATQGIHDLVGKRVMIEPQSDELFAYLQQEGIPVDHLQQIEHSFRPQDLVSGKVDAMSAYVTNETYFLDRAGVRYQTYTPRSAGIDFYGDNLFTSENELRQHPDRVRAFRDASLRGWQYALAHPDEIAELIHREYASEHSVDFLRYEARQMLPLLRPDLIEVGYMNPGRWRHIADTYADRGLLPRQAKLDGFLYQPDQHPDLTRLYIALALLAASSGLAFYIYRINRRLARALADSRSAQAALRVSEERHRLLADHASDVIWTLDRDGRFTYISPSLEKLSGLPVNDVLAGGLATAFAPESLARLQTGIDRALGAALAGTAVPSFREELEHRCRDGSTVWTETTVSGMYQRNGQFVGLLGVARDISERRRVEAQMRHLAQHDQLTGVPNRALFSDRLQQALAAGQRDRDCFALLYIDFDRFKPINDNHGHHVGDELLRQAAQRLLACLRESDTVARIGGDEFAVILRSITGADDALAAAAKLRDALLRPFLIDGLALSISASIGVALYPQHGRDGLALGKQADEALYRAKRSGRDQVCLAE